MNAIDPRFPLGIPLNRVAKPPLRRIPGRPNWFVDSRGIERYIEPTRAAPVCGPAIGARTQSITTPSGVLDRTQRRKELDDDLPF
jgi:hypothetical protein